MIPLRLEDATRATSGLKSLSSKANMLVWRFVLIEGFYG